MPVVAINAHRGRGVIHLARIIGPHETDPGLRLVSTSALCGASTAAYVFRGMRRPSSIRPGESPARTPTCKSCLSYNAAFPTPGHVIPGDWA